MISCVNPPMIGLRNSVSSSECQTSTRPLVATPPKQLERSMRTTEAPSRAARTAAKTPGARTADHAYIDIGPDRADHALVRSRCLEEELGMGS